jgi:hypothetical protein
MTKTAPLLAILAIAADACYRLLGLKPWHLLARSLPTAISAAPEILNLLTLTRGERKP